MPTQLTSIKQASPYWAIPFIVLLSVKILYEALLPVFEGALLAILYYLIPDTLPVVPKERIIGVQRKSSFIQSGHSHRTKAGSFSEEDVWLDSIDQGYFILRRDFSLSLVNKKGAEILKEFQSTFPELSDKLLEVEESRHTLKELIKVMMANATEGDSVKTMLGYAGGSAHRIRIDLFINYKAHMVKLRRGCVLIILKEKSQRTKVMVTDKIMQATNCTLSHELKTLLNGIVGSLELFEDSIKPEDRVHYRVAISSSHILSNRLNDWLDYMQILSSGLKLHYEEFDIDGLIKDIESICEWQAEQKKIKFCVTKDRSLRQTMIGDRARIQQVLLNILNKSIDFTDFGTVRLSVYMQQARNVCFKIGAEGSGIHNRLWSQIAHSSPLNRTTKYSTELGNSEVTQNIEEMYLEISQAICRQMDTKIVVETLESGGLELSFVLRDGFQTQSSPRLHMNAILKERRYSAQENKAAGYVNNIINSVLDKDEPRSSGTTRLAKYRKVDNISIISVSLGPTYTSFVENVQNVLVDNSQYNDEDVPSEGGVNFLQISSHCLIPHSMDVSSVPQRICTACPTQTKIDELPSKTEPPDSRKNVAASIETVQSRLSNAPLAPQRRASSKREKIKRTATQAKFRDIDLVPLSRKADSAEADDASHILIVDDNSTNRLVLKSLLRKFGHSSTEANNGLEAVKMVEKYIRNYQLHELKLVFMDLQMPIMDGIKSTKTILSLCENTGCDAPPIIGISSDISEEDRANFFLAGIEEFLNKPVHKEQVSRLISKYIKK